MPKKPKRGRSGRKYPRRKLWLERRDAAFERAGQICEVSGELLRFYTPNDPEHIYVWKRAADHIWPERWVRRFCKAADPHILENLVVVTPSLHAQKTAVEYLIFRADMVGYRRELNRLGFPPEMLDKALKAIIASVNRD
jgi:hypothetical protein